MSIREHFGTAIGPGRDLLQLLTRLDGGQEERAEPLPDAKSDHHVIRSTQGAMAADSSLSIA